MLGINVTAIATLYREPEQETYPDGSPKVVPEADWPKIPLPLITMNQVESSEPWGGNERHEYQRFRLSLAPDSPVPTEKDRIELPGFEDGGLFHVTGMPGSRVASNPFTDFEFGGWFGGHEVFVERRRR